MGRGNHTTGRTRYGRHTGSKTPAREQRKKRPASSESPSLLLLLLLLLWFFSLRRRLLFSSHLQAAIAPLALQSWWSSSPASFPPPYSLAFCWFQRFPPPTVYTSLVHAAHPSATLHSRLARFVSVDVHTLEVYNLSTTVGLYGPSRDPYTLYHGQYFCPHLVWPCPFSATAVVQGIVLGRGSWDLTSFGAGALLNGMFFKAFQLDTELVSDTRDILRAFQTRVRVRIAAVGSAQFPEPKPGAKVTFAPSGV
ncbi:hypothetical protein BO94DRAFT_245844 [Aspergillus sclerotioniger CBS 115572]|uniref:Uncharacterized protein n=1 Tax=Aspergillus sclerotioniger CBS 115572 TaxID=1450535 RepID=A0A317VH48_9EURO|nr:hypothetical protein BO94DRAFT_245844 [Aspergillus sclerotioniger CBS 115572]PWY72497.1 hypothetical protein BO94DRAFT_245844 [Aspergillus sclerotioniger CBS 115572]